MLSIDKPEIARAVTTLYGAYGREASENALAAWWESLKDLPHAYLVVRGLQAVVKTSKQLPTPAHVREWVTENTPLAPAAEPAYTHGSSLWPKPSEVLLARGMRREDVLADPLMGQRMLDWLDANPAPPPVPVVRPKARGVASQMPTADALLSRAPTVAEVLRDREPGE